MEEFSETNCPECKIKIRSNDGYQVWCQKCEWNLTFKNSLKPKTKLEEFYKKISLQHGKKLFVNASITEYGLLQKKVLFLGLPLWYILSNDERLALLGHEISHCVNGDPLKSRVVGTAINILFNMARAIYPSSLEGNLKKTYIGGLNSFSLWLSKFLIIPFNLFLRGIAKLIWLSAYGLSQMIWMDSQRAEYLADLLGASISSGNSVVKLLEKCEYYESLEFEIKKLVVKGKKEIEKANLFEIFKNKVENFPEHEKERIRRLMSKEEHRLDLRHPPTYFRIKMLNEKGLKISKTGEINTKIDYHKVQSELKIYEAKIQEKLIDKQRNNLYY